MKKTISILLAVMIIAGIFTACKNSEKEQDISQSSATSSAETEMSITSSFETELTASTTEPVHTDLTESEQTAETDDITSQPVEATAQFSAETTVATTASNGKYITIQGVKYSTSLTELDLHNKKLTNKDIIDI